MRVLYVQPGPGVGGSKISLRYILQYAPADQVSQVVLAFPADSAYEQSIASFTEKIHYMDLPTWNKYRRTDWLEKLKEPLSHIRRLLNLLPAIAKLLMIIRTEQIDIVHTNNSICPAGAFAAKWTNVPHVWHVREPIGVTGEYPMIVGDRLTSIIFKRLSRKVICISHYTAGFFEKWGVPAQVVQNGVDISPFQGMEAKQRGANLRQRLTGDVHGPVIAMIGNLTRWKEHKLFLKAAAKLRPLFPESVFIVFGGDSNLNATPYTRELKELSKQLGIQDCVAWADFIDDIPAIMHSMDVLLHPASKEGSGRVVMEVMAAGQAVVGVEAGGVRELIQDGVTGFLVQPDDVDAMVEKVRFLLENPQARIAMGCRAAEFAVHNFSNQGMMKSITAIYNELAWLK